MRALPGYFRSRLAFSDLICLSGSAIQHPLQLCRRVLSEEGGASASPGVRALRLTPAPACSCSFSKQAEIVQIQGSRLVHQHSVQQLDRQPRFQRDSCAHAHTGIVLPFAEREVNLLQVLAHR